PGPHYWMRADPVHLQVGRDSLGLADSAAFEVSRAESEALVDALSRHFGPTMLFQPLRPARWYVRLEKAPDVQTTPAAAARGLALAAAIPEDELQKETDSVLAAVGAEGRPLVVLEAPREAQPRGRRTELELDWFLTLLAALKSARIAMLTLQLCGTDSLLD